MTPIGEVEVLGRLSGASNGTLLVRDDTETDFVYKPVAGERPLWDFPANTLSRREVAAYQISETFGFGIVPQTTWWEGPYGPGSVQTWVTGPISDLVDLIRPEELTHDWLPVLLAEDEAGNDIVLVHRDDEQLRQICLFDLVINNSDRKAGHLIAAEDGLFGIDHGVSLHVEPKFRTVLWGFAGSELSISQLDQLETIAASSLSAPPGLTDEEWQAMKARALTLMSEGKYPKPGDGWPPIPWPAW